MLEGAYNFRDLGGLRTRDGHQLRSGRVFRSDTLQALTAADVNHLRAVVGLRGVVDLRLGEEVLSEGRGPLCEVTEVRYANTPLDMAATNGVAPEDVMRRLYLGCLSPEASLVTAIEQLSEMAEHPVVFHCAAGKDRTGVLAAVVLRMLNVADEYIVGDYMKSAEAMPRMIERFRTWPRYRDHMEQAPPQAYAVEPDPLIEVLNSLDRDYGGVHQWATSHGMRSEKIERLARLWVE
ncbi:tyrosine-protein phosphatase [Variovorax sp. Sphag1AA]|uniref:tyrosine-protein phosphatase n=1 Tax=Variovorax sp. Sphag1AA TaxID=2587027 RepID=UPI001619B59F|nr:tyrosine-protein phosphatase [Variovorax sp. Sphag1AA]